MGETAKLVPSDGEAEDDFGFSVSVSGDTVVVGAPRKNLFALVGGPHPDRGAAYVFVRPRGGWAGKLTESAKLTASDAADFDVFGTSVGVSGDRVVVGAPGDDAFGADRGSAYVFVRPQSGWSGGLQQKAKLEPASGSFAAGFGVSAAISGGTVVVGAPRQSVGGNLQQGAAYVFVEPASGWPSALTENVRLTAAGATDDAFGHSLGTNGAAVFVGAPGSDFLGIPDLGVAYVFVRPRAGWTGPLGQLGPDEILLASDGEAGDRFGTNVVVRGDKVLVSHFVVQPNTVYLYSKPANGWVTSFGLIRPNRSRSETDRFSFGATTETRSSAGATT
jgi:hypothetical protein